MSGRPAFPRRELLADVKALKRRGLTMQQIADTLGVSRATLYRYLDGGAR